MCGIAGLLSAGGRAPDSAALDALAEALAHRGPDGRGRHTAHGVGLVHNRLAIIDPAGGAQPLLDERGGALVANAEIYNYVELRLELDSAELVSGSDCAVILPLYRREGWDFLKRLRGMYALAFYDGETKDLFLARDPFGIKPLYYAETAEGFAFASEPQALIAAGIVTPRLRAAARDELLQLQFTTGTETIFEGIRRVLPGESLRVRDGCVAERRRLHALDSGLPEPWREEDALAELDRVLADSVYVHQRADVPYGMFLSGGIDSVSVLTMMARLNNSPVMAFTAGFDVAEAADERARARAVARALGAEHVEVAVGEADFWSLLPEIAAAMDDPAADYAVLPSYKLAREAARSLKVVLTGEGGDELFAGYGRYRRALRPRWLKPKPLRARGFLEGLGVLREEKPGWREGIAAAEAAEATGGRTALQMLQAVDCADWLPHDLLAKLDRCLMAHGLEGRVPLLDPVVARFAYHLPDRLKVRRGRGKWLLRRWLEDNLGEARAFRRKQGFTVPVGRWIAGRGREVGELVARRPCIEELCRPEAVRALFADPETRAGLPAWTLLFYALWHRRHIEGRGPAGDVFETLAGPA